MEFRSDGATWGAPEILERLSRESLRDDELFDEDEVTARLHERVAALFGRKASVFTVVTGSAANGLALAALTPSYGAVLAHWDAHIQTDECGAPEMFTNGAKIVSLAGEHGKIDPQGLDEYLRHARFGVTHSVQPKVLSITQATEAGTLYSVSELAALTNLAKQAGLRVHMDGARFSNAVAALGCAPADLVDGIDILCLGATKNGAIAADGILVFDPTLADTIRYLRKRSGHLIAKTRLLSAQMDTFLTDDLWLRNARHANAMAAKLSKGLARHSAIEFVHPTSANEIFVRMPDALLQHLQRAGVRLYVDWRTIPVRHHRIVASYCTTEDEVNKLLDLVENWRNGSTVAKSV
jgi:threonine aldolase